MSNEEGDSPNEQQEIVYSNSETEVAQNNQQQVAPPPFSPEVLSEEFLKFLRTDGLTLDNFKAKMIELRKQLKQHTNFFQNLNFVYLLVKEIIELYNTTYEGENELTQANLRNNKRIQELLDMLRVLKSDFGMNVFMGINERSRDRPSNLAAAAKSAIGIPILEILLDGHHQLKGLKIDMSRAFPDGLLEVQQAKSGFFLGQPQGERPPIFDAIEKNNINTVKYLLSQGSKINEIIHPQLKESPLSFAILSEINEEIAKLLVEKRGNVNFVDANGDPLLYSIMKNDFNWKRVKPTADIKEKSETRLFFVNLIVNNVYYSPYTPQKKIDDKKPEKKSETLLATELGCLKILEILLKNRNIKTKLQSSLSREFKFALNHSSYVSLDTVENKKNGSKQKMDKMDEILKYFLRQTEYRLPTYFDLSQNIPFIESAILKDKELLRLLVQRNFLVGTSPLGLQIQLEGNTNPITYAIQKEKLDSLKIIAEHTQFKEEVNKPDSSGIYPIVRAFKTKNKEIIDFLLSKGVGLEVTPSLFLYAIKNNLPDMVKIFLDKGVDPNQSDNYGNYPILEALKTKNKEMIDFLLSKGVDLKVKSPQGETVLMYAIKNNLLDMVKIFLDKGADPNQSDKDGISPLYLAIQMKNKELVNLLKSKGAKMDGLLTQAAMDGSIETVKELLAEGVDPTFKTIIDGKEFTAYALAKTTEIRLLLAPYMEKNKPRFEGFMDKEFGLFRNDYWNNVDYTKEELEWSDFDLVSVCPFCFFVNFLIPDTCNYVNHECSLTNNFYPSDLVETYKRKDVPKKTLSGWCTSCSRPTEDFNVRLGLGHLHFSIQPPIPYYRKIHITPPTGYQHDPYPFNRECYVYGGGGYIVEKFFKMQQVLDLMCKLNKEYVGKISKDIAYRLTREHFIGCTVPYKSFFEGKENTKQAVNLCVALKMLERVRDYLQFLSDITLGIGDIVENKDEFDTVVSGKTNDKSKEKELIDKYKQKFETWRSENIDEASFEKLMFVQSYILRHIKEVTAFTQNRGVDQIADNQKIEKLFSSLTSLKTNKTKNRNSTLVDFLQSLYLNRTFVSELIEKIDTSPLRLESEEVFKNNVKNKFNLKPEVIKQIIDDADTVRFEKKFVFPEDCMGVKNENVKNIHYDNVPELVKLLKKPKVIKNPPSDYNAEVGKIQAYMEGEVPTGTKLYKFIHAQPPEKVGDTPTYHTHDEYVSKWYIVNFITSFFNISEDTSSIQCFDAAVCKGNLHPMEIKFLFYSPIEVDQSFKEYEQAKEDSIVEEKKAGERMKLAAEFEARKRQEDDAYDQAMKTWRAGYGDLDELQQLDPEDQDLAKLSEKAKSVLPPDAWEALIGVGADPRILRKQYDREIRYYYFSLQKSTGQDAQLLPKPKWPEGLFQQRELDPALYVKKTIDWTEEETKARKERREKILKELWQKYANLWVRGTKEFVSKFGEGYDGENKNLNVENSPSNLNNNAQVGGGSYQFYSVGSIPGSCKTKRVKGGYRKTRKSKKVLKTRKAKRYNRTRKH